MFFVIVFCYCFFYGCKKDPYIPEVILPEFQKTYGGSKADVPCAILQTADNNYLILGYSESYGNGFDDFYLIKTDQNGNLLWEKWYGGANRDAPSGMFATSDGGYILYGHSKSFAFGKGFEVFLVKTDADGNMQWQKTFGDNMNDCANAVVPLPGNSGYMLAGGTGGVILTCNRDIYYAQISNTGDSLWSGIYGDWAENDEAVGLADDGSGNYLLLCNTFGYGTANGGIVLMGLNTSGDSLWSKFIDGSGWDEAKIMKRATDGGLIIAGMTNGAYGYETGDMYAVKLSVNNLISWEKNFGGEGYDVGEDVIQTSDGGFLFAGHSKSFSNEKSDIYLVKTDYFGTVQWNKLIGGEYEEQAFAVMETSDAYVIAGQKTVQQENPDFFLAKIKKY